MRLSILFMVLVVSLSQKTFGQHEKELTAPTDEQFISFIDKKVAEMKKEKESYRKIISKKESCRKEKNEKVTCPLTGFKKENELLIIQRDEKDQDKVFDYYLNNNELIYCEIKNSDNTLTKSYFRWGTIFAEYCNGKKIEVSPEMNTTEAATMKSIHRFIRQNK